MKPCYIDIHLTHLGINYPAKLYGDRIVSTGCDLTISQTDVVTYKIHRLKNKIRLHTNTAEVLVDYHDVIVRWFDPLYTLRVSVIGIFGAFPLLFAFSLSGFRLAIPTILFSSILSFSGSSLAYIYFRIIRVQSDFLFAKLIVFLLAVSLPVMYWYPFSVYIITGSAGLVSIFLVLQYLFSRSWNMYNYYVSLGWIVLVIFFYFWMISAYKIWMDYRAYAAPAQVLKISSDHNTISYGGLSWEKPIDWKLSDFNFHETIFKRRELLWQISAIPVSQKISTTEYPEFGWISVSENPPSFVLDQLGTYLKIQENLMLADLLEMNIPSYVPSGVSSRWGKLPLRSLTYYDMIERKISVITILLVPVGGHDKQGTMIFAFKLPQSASLNFYLDLIFDGLKK